MSMFVTSWSYWKAKGINRSAMLWRSYKQYLCSSVSEFYPLLSHPTNTTITSTAIFPFLLHQHWNLWPLLFGSSKLLIFQNPLEGAGNLAKWWRLHSLQYLGSSPSSSTSVQLSTNEGPGRKSWLSNLLSHTRKTWITGSMPQPLVQTQRL